MAEAVIRWVLLSCQSNDFRNPWDWVVANQVISRAEKVGRGPRFRCRRAAVVRPPPTLAPAQDVDLYAIDMEPNAVLKRASRNLEYVDVNE